MTDEFEGQGGSYVLDKKTGRRKLVERTTAPAAASPETPAPAAPGPAPIPPDPAD